MKKLTTLLGIVFVLGLFPVLAQDYLTAEVAHPLSNKAEMGYLGNVEANDAAKELSLFFVTKTKAKKIKVEKYVFDYDMKFKGTEKLEYDRAQDVKSKYAWFNFRNQEVETFYGVTVEPSITGIVSFKKKEITNYWSWALGRYTTKIKTLEKLKARSDEGSKFYNKASFDNNVTGEVIAVMGKKGGIKEFDMPYMAHEIWVVDKDLNVKSKVELNFTSPQHVLYSGQFDTDIASDGLYEGDYAMIFAPFEVKGSKNNSETPDEYTFIRISPQGKIVDRITFKSQASRWRIEGIHLKDDKVTIYGPGVALKKTKDAMVTAKTAFPLEKGFTNFQVVGIEGKSVKYVSSPSIAELDAATIAPAGQKKAQTYGGKRIRVTGLTTAANGDVMIAAQMVNKNLKTQAYTYKDFMVIHISKEGKLRKVYSIDTPAKGGIYNTTDPLNSPAYYTSSTAMYPSKDGKSMYWITALVTQIDEFVEDDYFSGTRTTTYIPREQMIMSKINVEKSSMDAVQTLGDGVKGRKDFFLRKDIRYATINNGESLIVLGEDRIKFGLFKGDNYLYLGRIDLK